MKIIVKYNQGTRRLRLRIPSRFLLGKAFVRITAHFVSRNIFKPNLEAQINSLKQRINMLESQKELAYSSAHSSALIENKKSLKNSAHSASNSDKQYLSFTAALSAQRGSKGLENHSQTNPDTYQTESTKAATFALQESTPSSDSASLTNDSEAEKSCHTSNSSENLRLPPAKLNEQIVQELASLEAAELTAYIKRECKSYEKNLAQKLNSIARPLAQFTRKHKNFRLVEIESAEQNSVIIEL